VPNFPRLRALALFGRRPPQRVEGVVMPASKNLHRNGHRGRKFSKEKAARRRLLNSNLMIVDQAARGL